MRRLLLIAVTVSFGVTAYGHDLFLKCDSYFLQPQAKAVARLMNGTFLKSDGLVARTRLQDVSVLSPHSPKAEDAVIEWRDENQTTVMQIQTGDAGTYVAGVSTMPREIELKAADFNDYLSHDGLPDTLHERRQKRELKRDIRERYSKHVRAIFQVGGRQTDDYKRPLNYPVEIIPQLNPYSLRVGDTISLLCLLNGKPVANQFVMAGRDAGDGKNHVINLRSDRNGIARIWLNAPGKWFVKFIHMTRLNDANLNYESRWASLTFEIKG